MKNTKLLDALDNNGLAIANVGNLIFMTRQVAEMYFNNTEPGKMDFDRLKEGYPYLQQWFEVFSYHGDKVLEDMQKVSTGIEDAAKE